MRRFQQTALLFLILAAMATAATAGPFFLTGKLGNTSLDANTGDFRQIVDGDDNSWTLGLGLRFGDYLVFQAEFHDFGSVPGLGAPCPPDSLILCDGDLVLLEADSSAVSVSFLPHLPLGERAFLYGKLGFVSWESDITEAIDAGSDFFQNQDGEDLIYGAGFRWKLPGPFTVFAEYEKISDTFETVALGATWGF